MTVTDVAQAYGTDRSTVHRWLKRFDMDGEAGLERKPESRFRGAHESLLVSMQTLW